jgi:hypothetical protein
MHMRAPNEWLNLKYLSSEKILLGLLDVQLSYPLHELRYQAASLRTRELREFGEGRQAALFCYGMSQRIGHAVSFAQHEARDYDVVARIEAGDQLSFVPVQLKEWVPEHVNPSSSLQAELDKLTKYADAKDLCVAVYLNRATKLDFSQLQLPFGKVAELWFYWCSNPQQGEWTLAGNLVGPEPGFTSFQYPLPAHAE